MTLRESFRRAMRISNPSEPTSPSMSTSSSTTSSSSSARTTPLSSPPTSTHSLPLHIPMPPVPSTSVSSTTARRITSKKSSTSLSAPRRALAGLARHAMNQHPRVKPLTKANMVYQDMLGEFTMTFGATRRRGSMDSAGGISPCTSRRGSIEMDLSA